MAEILLGFMELPALVADLNAMTGKGKVPLFPVGEYDHSTAGKIQITEDDLRVMADTFNAAGHDAPIDYDHSFHYGKGSRAAGWVKAGSAYVSDGFLWGDVEWTPQAADDVRSRAYRFISPEWNFSGKTRDNRMKDVEFAAATLTNRPFFKGMPAIVASKQTLGDLLGDVILSDDEREDAICILGDEFETMMMLVHAAEEGPRDHARKVVLAAASSKKPYGNVTYADPGYQSDGKARYPIDTEEHVRAAWSYINQAKNGAKYKPGQVARIKSRIRAAMKRLGAEIAADCTDDEVTNMMATIPVGAMNALADTNDNDEDDAPPVTDYKPGEPAPEPVDTEDGNTNKRSKLAAKGDEMDRKELAKLLGLPEDSSEEQVTTAIAEAAKAKATPPEPTKDDQSALAIAAAAQRELREMKRDTLIASAVADGKITPAEKDFYVGAYDRDPDGTSKYLAEKQKVIDFRPVGSDSDVDDEGKPTAERLEAIAEQEFGSALASMVNPDSFKLHTAALGIIEQAGKLLTYTADEYVAAVKQAERKTGIANVHTAMLPPKSTATV